MSFIEHSADTHFPIQNIPFGAFTSAKNAAVHLATRLGDSVVDLNVLAEAGLLSSLADGGACFKETTLNTFMSQGRTHWRAARALLQNLLSKDNATLRDNADVRAKAIMPVSEVSCVLPATIGDYTDFYASKEHATNVGIMFRGKENALLPNWLHLPVGYHGRSSSVVVSGTDLKRPRGQTKADDADAPSFTPCRLCDFELEMAYFVGPGNGLGDPISMDKAPEQLFGMAILNDWSARDIQKWEYVPLGPFGAKNWGSSLSAWVVTMDAIEPFRVAAPGYEQPILPYLEMPAGQTRTNPDIQLEVAIKTPQSGDEAMTLCKSNFKYMYWTPEQQLVHHSVTGCNMRPGDLLGSGTISGPEESMFGSMLELCWKGTKPINLPNGEVRKFLQDNDTVVMTGFMQGDGYKVGFGECVGKVLPANQ